MEKVKYILSILIITCSFGFTNKAYAQTSTPRPTAVSPTVSEAINEKLNSQINQLKDKIASRVSELNLVEKRGVTGVVKETSTNKITLTDLSGNTKNIDIDEITKFSSASARGTFGLSDLTKGTKINVLGLYNKQSKRILARFITTAVNPVFLTGTISATDSKNFTINIISSDKKDTKIDIGTTTKLSENVANVLTKIGFSGLSIGERVSIVGFPDKTDPVLIVASRIVTLPDSPTDPSVSIAVPSSIPSPTLIPTSAIRRTTQVTPTSSVRTSPTISR